MKVPLNPYNDSLIPANYNFEGLVERRCLLKNFKEPNISKWKKYWVAICEHLLFFHKQRSFLITLPMRLSRQTSLKKNDNISIAQSKLSNMNITLTETDRLYYRQNPSKCQSITDWLIVLSQTKNRNEIQLSDLTRGSMYKFKFENAAIANIWFQRLKEATLFKQTNGQLSENLIALD
ncbi:unnamed protein product [Rotaria socialis]|nr:unnamed protein product [Rotaria socialis]